MSSSPIIAYRGGGGGGNRGDRGGRLSSSSPTTRPARPRRRLVARAEGLWETRAIAGEEKMMAFAGRRAAEGRRRPAPRVVRRREPRKRHVDRGPGPRTYSHRGCAQPIRAREPPPLPSLPKTVSETSKVPCLLFQDRRHLLLLLLLLRREDVGGRQPRRAESRAPPGSHHRRRRWMMPTSTASSSLPPCSSLLAWGVTRSFVLNLYRIYISSNKSSFGGAGTK